MRDKVRQYLEDLSRRGEADRRNGSFRRWLLTAMGAVELCVPRTRTFSPVAIVQAFARRERHVDRLILACFVLGLSTRKVGQALLTILGARISPSTVSRVATQLDSAVAAFHQWPLANRYRVLVLDGVVLSRRTGAGAVRRPVLVALGITNDGRREVLDFRLMRAESRAAWETFLTDLRRRGLTGEGLTLIACDGGAGLFSGATRGLSQRACAALLGPQDPQRARQGPAQGSWPRLRPVPCGALNAGQYPATARGRPRPRMKPSSRWFDSCPCQHSGASRGCVLRVSDPGHPMSLTYVSAARGALATDARLRMDASLDSSTSSGPRLAGRPGLPVGCPTICAGPPCATSSGRAFTRGSRCRSSA